MDLISFLNQRKAAMDSGNDEALKALEKTAAKHVTAFLNGTIAAETETSPLFYSFFRTFSQTDDDELKQNCEKALEKLQPYLDRFDTENHLTHLDDLEENILARNLEKLAVFDQINPFEMKKKNQLVFSDFAELFSLTEKIEITDENGKASSKGHENFITTLIESAKLQAFTTLSLSVSKISQKDYLTEVRQNMENNLVLMFVADKALLQSPPTEKTKDLLHAEYKKLLIAVSQE